MDGREGGEWTEGSGRRGGYGQVVLYERRIKKKEKKLH